MGIERAPSLPKFVMVAAVVRSGQSKKNPTWQTEGARAINRATFLRRFSDCFCGKGERRETRPATQFRAVSENVSVPLLLYRQGRG